MFKTDIVFDLIAKTLGMEHDAKELHALLELYALAYVEDLEATEDLSALRATCGEEAATSAAVSSAEAWWEKAPEEAAGLAVDITDCEAVSTEADSEDAPCVEPAACNWSEEQQSYRGFLALRCAHCGEEAVYHAKYPLTYHRCKSCGQDTALVDMTTVYANCECGQRSRYATNQTQWGFDIPCIACGNLVPVEYVAGKHMYATVGTRGAKSKKTKKNAR